MSLGHSSNDMNLILQGMQIKLIITKSHLLSDLFALCIEWLILDYN